MASRSAPSGLLTIDEYLAFEETSPVRHEYVGGTLYALAGGSDRHNRIALNIASTLLADSRTGPCRVYMADMKLQVGQVFYYPDVMVGAKNRRRRTRFFAPTPAC